MRYLKDEKLTERVREIIGQLGLTYIESERVTVVRSIGSRGKAVARIWSVPRAVLVGFDLRPLYVIEIINEKFEKLTGEERTKVLIHELLHIPKSFGGGLRQHGRLVNEREVERLAKRLGERLNK
ncbi:hypothetical protein HS1genome_0149 [Sulfodiicoccus acidiphilus]|uniref:Putative phage metallopeptidase domain-containing protein n=1 Tax=Sulfodiicoccus acidiphilus TaxID=1670455 RepID=A0A348B0Q8_9CREN|nr:putative metallopeptidase [Sulfodiicoccus acidiphilus]BBD71760.1 hypothetical protein HS1genome_0149 [Sulfodiicoccus acidiphilus]GGT99054.1 hypothetical protein GCM10007116_15440 [Sulfodiicoccus acidiphilus]